MSCKVQIWTSVPNLTLQTTINDFYEVEVIAEAKKYLYYLAVNCVKEISIIISR